MPEISLAGIALGADSHPAVVWIDAAEQMVD